MLSVELSPTNVSSDHEIFQINSVSISTAINMLVGEWSHNMFTAVSQLLKHWHMPHGILKKRHQSVDNKDVSIVDNRTTKKDTDSSKSLVSKWFIVRDDMEELDISFSFQDINLFFYNNTPSDPSVLLRMDNSCIKTLEGRSGKIEDLVLVAHCNNFILLPFSVDHVTEVRKNVIVPLSYTVIINTAMF